MTIQNSPQNQKNKTNNLDYPIIINNVIITMFIICIESYNNIINKITYHL